MSNEKKNVFPMKSPIEWVFRTSMLLLAAVIALNLTVSFLRIILSWLIGGSALIALTWITVAIVRWKRSNW